MLRPHLDTVSKIIEPTVTSFCADPDLFDVDLWRLEHALRQAATAPDDVAAIAALAAIADLYPGDLLDGLFHEWAAPEREDLRRRVLDALSRLAHLAEKHGRPNDALIALDRAVALDPYAEGLYQHAIRIHIELGQPDAARRLYRQLENRLVDIDAEPDEQTARLLLPPVPRQVTVTAT